MRCEGSGRMVSHSHYLNLKLCSECPCAWDPDMVQGVAPEHDRGDPIRKKGST